MFAPLRVISGYSFLQSGLTIEKIAKNIQSKKYDGVGLSDSNFLYGVPSFVEECKKLKVKNIFGLEIQFENNYLIVYAYNEDGYRNLIRYSSLLSQDKFDFSVLKENHNGIIGVLETNYGKFREEFSDKDEFSQYFAKISNLVDHFYLGLEVNTKEEFEFAKSVRDFAKDHGYLTIAFPRIRYEMKDDAIILKLLDAIDKGEKIEEKEASGEQYFKTAEQYSKVYTKTELDRTMEVISMSTFDLNQKRGEITHFPVENSVEELKRLVKKSLIERNLKDEAHINRAKYELETIISLGYADYFLIVMDYVKYAKENGILVGPGRGSAAGSLVSYLLDITEVDPLEYDLQFERFLNKARKSMPDIDVDFMDIYRDKMVDYMREKYGADHVANIVAFQTIQAKQALRDIGRIYDIPTRHIDLLSKSITDKVSLREAYKTIPTFRQLVDSDKYFLEIVSMASKIEGLPRQAGLHAAGIIINEQVLDTVLPVTIDYEGHYTSQYEKDYIEQQGFLKMDFLALRNLTVIDACIKLVNERYNKNLSFYGLPFDDPKIFELLRKGQTAGVFQLESSGMKNAIKIIKPDCFEDVVTVLAIFRPGPMDNIKDYANRKQGKIKSKYISEDIKNILAPTYGVLIYQEQISKIATAMAGFSPEDADLFRRAVSHKEKSVLESSRNDFISGAVKKGYSQKDASEMFNHILKFASYGFNRSHAVVYAITACRMAYLKYYYPLEFYAATLNISSGGSDSKFSDYVNELKSRNLKVDLPNINVSTKEFIRADNSLLYPLSMIRGVNTDVVNKILDERIEKGKFKDFFEFVSRAYYKGISEIVINKLINSGALDVFGKNRATLRATLRYAYQLAELSLDKDGQLILDETLSHQKQYFEDVDDPLTNLNLEYEELGIMLSDNPLRYKKDLLDKYHVISTVDAKESYQTVYIAGIVSKVKIIKSRKNNTTMAFVTLFDELDNIEITVFSRVYEQCFSLLEKNQILLVKGRYEHKQEKESFIADEISLLEE